MTKQRIAYLSGLVMSAVLFLGLLMANVHANDRRIEESVQARFLADVLREDIASDDDGILCANVGLASVDSRSIPEHAVIYRSPEDSLLKVSPYGYDDMSLPPGDMMQAATYTWLLDKKRITLNDRIPTGPDSVLVREAFLRPSDEVSMPAFDRKTLFSDSYYFVSSLSRYFGSTRNFYLPRYYYSSLLEDEYRSIFDGSGILLSQDQLLSFYGSIARKGVKPDKAWYRRMRICSEETASALAALLRENVLSGKDSLLAKNTVPIAAKSGSGILDKGRLPYRKVSSSDPVRVSSFVGFFPSHAPKYTLCVTVYSSDVPKTETAARIFGDIVDHLTEEGKL